MSTLTTISIGQLYHVNVEIIFILNDTILLACFFMLEYSYSYARRSLIDTPCFWSTYNE